MLIFQYNRERQFKVEELNIRLQTINAEILNDIEEGGNPSEIRNSVSDVHRLRVSIIDSTGRVISDNTLDRLPEGNHLNREEIAKAMKTGSGYAIRRHSESTGETYFYSATKGKTGVIVRTAAPYSVSLTESLQADYGFMWFTFSLASCLCILGFFATRRLGQNVSRLNLFAQKPKEGNASPTSSRFRTTNSGKYHTTSCVSMRACSRRRPNATASTAPRCTNRKRRSE